MTSSFSPPPPSPALPEPPYYAVIFSSALAPDADGYEATAENMLALAAKQSGFLGVESVRGADGRGLTVSYWADMEAISHWRDNTTHQAAQRQGKSDWYTAYQVRICRVERSYGAGQANEGGGR